MSSCASCSSPIPTGARYCPACGVAASQSDHSPTMTSAQEWRASGDSPLLGAAAGPGAGRFVPGVVLGARYRIVGRIGRGGMGEVYRADDLKLGQSVALKFLPAGLHADPQRRERLLNEVRLALRVTHPSVCRVYDLGEFEGQQFLSMEYVDGEDLASLLRRIGRLPSDKAVQVARQLCAGLAAAHQQGILHRDLKPANVMLDGQGRVKITDFGLAGIAETIHGAEVRSGTPAYMAPEQLAGQAVTARSDLYALGLVLYELFTGTPAITGRTPDELARAHRESTPSSPSALVEGIDARVERVILRCLEKDPRRRPESALAVAAALPGGDPLAAALAAGETPSPGMVAAAGDDEATLRPVVAAACIALFAVAVATHIFAASKFPQLSGLLGFAPDIEPKAVLVRTAAQVVRQLGHDEPPVGRASGFDWDSAYLRWVEDNDPALDRWRRLAAPRAPAPRFWYRSSPRLLVPEARGDGAVTASDPPMRYSGEVLVQLDRAGRLLSLTVVPAQVLESAEIVPEPAWSALFTLAALDPADYDPVGPRWSPAHFADRRAAWQRRDEHRRDIPARVEAASFAGRPVWFSTFDEWSTPSRMVETEARPGQAARAVAVVLFFLSILAGSLMLAQRNLRLGRGDRRGAFKVAAFVFVAIAVSVGLMSTPIPDFDATFGSFLEVLLYATFLAALSWLAYIALEPFLRRRWPDAMISWSRLLEGRFRDPLIGRDIVVGAAASGAFLLVESCRPIVERLSGLPPDAPIVNLVYFLLLDGRTQAGFVVLSAVFSWMLAMSFLFLLLIFRILLRRHWIAVAALVLLLSVLGAIGASLPLWNFGVEALFWTAALTLMTRFGLVSAVALFFFGRMLSLVSLADFSAWYSGGAIAVLSLLAAVVGFGFYTSLGRRQLFGGSIVPAE